MYTGSKWDDSRRHLALEVAQALRLPVDRRHIKIIEARRRGRVGDAEEKEGRTQAGQAIQSGRQVMGQGR